MKQKEWSIEWTYWPILILGIAGVIGTIQAYSFFYDPTWELNWQVELFMWLATPFCIGLGILTSWYVNPRVNKQQKVNKE